VTLAPVSSDRSMSGGISRMPGSWIRDVKTGGGDAPVQPVAISFVP
jgi:hypothetical protein